MTRFNLTAEQRQTFQSDGVVCLRGVLTSDEIGALQTAVEQQYAGLGTSRTGYDFEQIARQIWAPDASVDTGTADRFDMQALKENILADPFARPLLDDELDAGSGSFFYDVAAWQTEDAVRRVAFDSILPETVASLLDTPTLNFWEDTTFVKAPKTKQRTAFHQDLAYFQIEGDQCVIVWIPLDPANTENGVTEYVRGSHLWGDVFAPNVFVTQTPIKSSPEQRCPDIEANRSDYDIVTFDVVPGDVIVHHVRTVHGAGGNGSDRWRRAMSFRYTGADVRYKNRQGAIPQVGMTHDLQDGDPLFSKDYPLVYPRPWPDFSLADAYNNS